MIHLERYGDVTRVVMSTAATRAVGYAVSAYLVRGILIDSGFHGARAGLERWLERERVEGVLLTHHHEDHAGNVALLVRAGIPLAADDATWTLLRAVAPLPLYRRLIWGTPPSAPAAALAGDAERFASRGLRLVPTPGHSPDHHAVWDAESGTLFGGDLFLGTRVRVAHPAEHPRQLAVSLRRAAALAPERLFDAHRGSVPEPVDALRRKADWIDETAGRIDEHARAGWSERRIARAVLGREAGPYYLSRGHMSKIAFVRAVLDGQ